MVDDVGVDRPGWRPPSRSDEPDHHRQAAAVHLLGMDLDRAGVDDRDGPDGSSRARTRLLHRVSGLRVAAAHGLLPSRTDACGRPVETMMHPARAGSTTSLDGRPDSSSLAGARRLVEPIGIPERGVGRSDGRTTTRSPDRMPVNAILNARQQAVDARARWFESLWVGPMAGLHLPGHSRIPAASPAHSKSRAPPPWARSAAPQLGGPLPCLRP